MSTESGKESSSILTNCSILLTGGCGSFGTAFITEALKHDPKVIRIYDNNEDALASMQVKYRMMGEPRLRFFFGDVRDKDRLAVAMRGTEIVIHAAALKHVGLMEYNPQEAIKTNIMGSINIVDCALNLNPKICLAISSDKAVEPINIYGATKLTMEKLFTQAATFSKVKFGCVRLGNIMGSRGSVLSRWKESLDKGEPINITDDEMTRFWMTQEEAVKFAIARLKDVSEGEIFIPKIPELALKELMRALPEGTKINRIGRQVGEKQREVLFADHENAQDMGDYFVIRSKV